VSSLLESNHEQEEDSKSHDSNVELNNILDKNIVSEQQNEDILADMMILSEEKTEQTSAAKPSPEVKAVNNPSASLVSSTKPDKKFARDL
jgi:hypothetical protein